MAGDEGKDIPHPHSASPSSFLAMLENAKIPRHKNRSASTSFLFLKSWLGMRDSNPRMVGPEPTALPLGESPVH